MKEKNYETVSGGPQFLRPALHYTDSSVTDECQVLSEEVRILLRFKIAFINYTSVKEDTKIYDKDI